MPKLVNKTFSSLKTEGLIKTLAKIGGYTLRIYPFSIIKQRSFKKNILTLKNIEDRFTEIYKRNYWGSKESFSGSGSTISYTRNLREKLPELFKALSVKTLFDAPCGDFNWMRHVLKENNLEYIGGDIVLPLIESHNSKYKNSKTKFIHIDLTKEKLPDADLMICRDCLFHLSFQDTKLVMQNFIDSKIPYLLTTTHINNKDFENSDITTGDYRPIDLFSAPYYFPLDVLFRIEDWKEPEPKREMCLWTKEQVIYALEKFKGNSV